MTAGDAAVAKAAAVFVAVTGTPGKGGDATAASTQHVGGVISSFSRREEKKQDESPKGGIVAFRGLE